MPSTSRFDTQAPQADFNPAERQFLTFAEKIPSILDIGIAKLNWILTAQIFLDGVDFSHWNWTEGNEPDFSIVKENGFDFVILKATESDWFVDDKFEPGWMASLDNDLIVMPYHFNRTNKGGASQAHWMLDHIGDYLKAVDGKTVLWDDVETNDGGTIIQHQNRVLAYHQTMESEGFQSGNYSSYYLWKIIMGDKPLPWVNRYRQWFAHWTPSLNPLKPIGWNLSEFWQYGIWPTYSWAKMVGTNGKVDVNRFYGTLADLKKMLGMNSIPSDCCDELRKELDEVYVRLASQDGDIADNQRRLTIVENNYLTLSQRVDLIDNEARLIKNKVAGLENNQQAMQEQIDRFLELLDLLDGFFSVGV